MLVEHRLLMLLVLVHQRESDLVSSQCLFSSLASGHMAHTTILMATTIPTTTRPGTGLLQGSVRMTTAPSLFQSHAFAPTIKSVDATRTMMHPSTTN